MNWEDGYREFILSAHYPKDHRPSYEFGWICHPHLHGKYMVNFNYLFGTNTDTW